MALYIPQSIFHLALLLYVRPEAFGPYYVLSRNVDKKLTSTLLKFPEGNRSQLYVNVSLRQSVDTSTTLTFLIFKQAESIINSMPRSTPPSLPPHPHILLHDALRMLKDGHSTALLCGRPRLLKTVLSKVVIPLELS